MVGLIILGLPSSVWWYWQKTSEYPAVDFCTIWAVPRTFTHGTDFYAREDQLQMGERLHGAALQPGAAPVLREAAAAVLQLYGGRVDATGSPLLYAIAGWMTGNEYSSAERAYRVLSFLCLVASVVLLCTMLDIPGLLAAFLLTMTLAWFKLVANDVLASNVNQVVLLVLAVFLWLLAKSERTLFAVSSGIVGGLGMLLKPTIFLSAVFCLIVLLVDRKFRRFRDVVGGTLLGIAAGSYFGDYQIWVHFAGSLRNMLSYVYRLEDANIGLSSLIQALTGADVSAPLLLLFVAAFCSVVGATALPAVHPPVSGPTGAGDFRSASVREPCPVTGALDTRPHRDRACRLPSPEAAAHGEVDHGWRVPVKALPLIYMPCEPVLNFGILRLIQPGAGRC